VTAIQPRIPRDLRATRRRRSAGGCGRRGSRGSGSTSRCGRWPRAARGGTGTGARRRRGPGLLDRLAGRAGTRSGHGEAIVLGDHHRDAYLGRRDVDVAHVDGVVLQAHDEPRAVGTQPSQLERPGPAVGGEAPVHREAARSGDHVVEGRGGGPAVAHHAEGALQGPAPVAAGIVGVRERVAPGVLVGRDRVDRREQRSGRVVRGRCREDHRAGERESVAAGAGHLHGGRLRPGIERESESPQAGVEGRVAGGEQIAVAVEQLGRGRRGRRIGVEGRNGLRPDRRRAGAPQTWHHRCGGDDHDDGRQRQHGPRPSRNGETGVRRRICRVRDCPTRYRYDTGLSITATRSQCSQAQASASAAASRPASGPYVSTSAVRSRASLARTSSSKPSDPPIGHTPSMTGEDPSCATAGVRRS
jgi:hypothetical protein